jgi:Ca2+-binding EF-hand superfamily protein
LLKDGNGRITIAELKKILNNDESIRDEELEEIIKEVDTNSDN